MKIYHAFYYLYSNMPLTIGYYESKTHAEEMTLKYRLDGYPVGVAEINVIPAH